MKISKNLIASVLVTLFFATPVMAGQGHSSMDKGMKMKHGKMMNHKSMMRGNMKMMKEIMVILRDLNHRPTPAQKKRLTGMINKMDKMMKMHKMSHKMKNMKGNMKEMGANPCSSSMMNKMEH